MVNIKKDVLNKLDKNFSIQLTKELYDTNFFSPKVGLLARHFIDLIYEIEDEFSIKFDEQSLINPEFCTLNGFVKKIEEKINC